jgi:hypothetical protein
MSNLSISISIGAIETNMMTDAPLSFDAIETLLTRVVTSTLNVYMALPQEERMRVIYDVFSGDDDDDDEDN